MYRFFWWGDAPSPSNIGKYMSIGISYSWNMRSPAAGPLLLTEDLHPQCIQWVSLYIFKNKNNMDCIMFQDCTRPILTWKKSHGHCLGGGFKHLLLSPLFGEDFRPFWWAYFSTGLVKNHQPSWLVNQPPPGHVPPPEIRVDHKALLRENQWLISLDFRCFYCLVWSCCQAMWLLGSWDSSAPWDTLWEWMIFMTDKSGGCYQVTKCDIWLTVKIGGIIYINQKTQRYWGRMGGGERQQKARKSCKFTLRELFGAPAFECFL